MCLGELLREEQRLATQANMGADISSSDVEAVAYVAKDEERINSNVFTAKDTVILLVLALKKSTITANNQDISSRSVVHNLRTPVLPQASTS